MAREVAGLIRLQIKGGTVNPSPPVDPALGSKGINTMGSCKEFNARAQNKTGKALPVITTYYNDKSSSFIIKTPPAAVQLMEVTKVKGGSGKSNRKKVAPVTWEQVRAIIEDKMPDLSRFTVEGATKLIVGTARSTGIVVKGDLPGKQL